MVSLHQVYDDQLANKSTLTLIVLHGFSASGAVACVRDSSAMCMVRQARHQQPEASCGNGTAAGSAVHQHGSPVLSAMAQEKIAPQRVHVLIGVSAC